MVRYLLTGKTTDDIVERIVASPLIPFAKVDGGVRPIAPEGSILNLISHVGLSLVDKEFSNTHLQSQFGVVGTRTDAEVLRKILFGRQHHLRHCVDPLRSTTAIHVEDKVKLK